MSGYEVERFDTTALAAACMTTEDVLVAGETLVDFVPEATGPLETVESFTRRAGGAPANVAVALSRLDRTPLFWTRVGDDPFGAFLAERLREEGLPERFVERDADARTTLAFVGSEDEDPTFSFYRDGTADARLELGAVPDDALDAVEWVHAGGVALATEPARSATLDLLERAAELDCTVSFDPNVRPELWANDAELATVCGWAVASTDVLVATPAELRALGYDGRDSAALARAATADGPHTVALTLGADGALAVATAAAPWSGTARHEGFDVEAVDPTGAGDAFTAGLIDALRRGRGLGEALGDANAVGALATAGRGAMATLPTRSEVRALRT